MTQTIRQLRDEHGESRQQLADAVGVTLSELTDWELGRAEPTFTANRALVEHFGIAEHELEIRPAAMGGDVR